MSFTGSARSSVDSLATEEQNRQHDALRQELGDVLLMEKDAWASSLYCVPPPNAIHEYFNTDGGEHCNGRWTRIPKAPALASELHGPICRIINSLIDRFVASKGQGAREAVLGSSLCQRKPQTAAAPEKPIVPGIAIRATGPSFVISRGSSSVLSDVAACIDAKVDSEASTRGIT